MEKFVKFFVPRFIWDKIERNPELKKILANINWLFFDKLVQMTVAFFVGVWVIRYLGPEKYGVLSYVIAFTALFGVLSKLGLEAILVRELVNNKTEKEKFLGTAFFIKFIGSLFAVIFSVLAIFLSREKDVLVVIIALIISSGFIFQSFEVIDYWFRSKVASKSAVYSKMFASIFCGLAKILLIFFQAPLIFFALFILLESILLSMGLIYFYKKNKQRIKSWVVDNVIAKKLIKDSWPLTFSSISVIIYMKIDQVMIGNMIGDVALGNYSAAVTLSEAWYFIPIIVTNSVFPAILYAKKQNNKLYLERIQTLYDIFVWISIPVALIISLSSNFIINVLYGAEYHGSASVLSIHIWSSIFVFIGTIVGKFLIAENLGKIAFYRTFLGALANIILNLLMIPHYGINGAAIATLISQIISVFSIVFFEKSRINISMIIQSINILKILKRYV